MLWGVGGVGKGGKEGFLCINGIVALVWGLEIYGWELWGGGIVKWVALVQYVCISTGVSRNGGWRRWIGWFLAI